MAVVVISRIAHSDWLGMQRYATLPLQTDTPERLPPQTPLSLVLRLFYPGKLPQDSFSGRMRNCPLVDEPIARARGQVLGIEGGGRRSVATPFPVSLWAPWTYRFLVRRERSSSVSVSKGDLQACEVV